MRISIEWLSELISLPSTEELEHIFEMAGIGVKDRQGDVFTLEITSNRGDWLSVVGLANELSAMLDRPVQAPSGDLQPTGPPIHGRVTVSIEEGQDCARYI